MAVEGKASRQEAERLGCQLQGLQQEIDFQFSEEEEKYVTDEEDGGETPGDVHVVGGPGEACAKLPGGKKSHESNLLKNTMNETWREEGEEKGETYPCV